MYERGNKAIVTAGLTKNCVLYSHVGCQTRPSAVRRRQHGALPVLCSRRATLCHLPH